MFDQLITLVQSPFFYFTLKGLLIYLGALWLFIVLFVGRDIIHRTNNIFFQIAVILLNMVLPIFGLLLYLIIRPSKTLLEQYSEEMEVQFLSEQAQEKEKCYQCETPLHADFLFCPVCATKIKTTCHSCGKRYFHEYQVCPYCGKRAEKKKKKP